MKEKESREGRIRARRVKRKLKGYEEYLKEEERSPATIAKYVRQAEGFLSYAKGEVSREKVSSYKAHLIEEGYDPATVNNKLSAIRSFIKYMGREEIKVKNVRCQKSPYLSEEKMLKKEEYERLTKEAQRQGQESLDLIMQTICSCGIRVSELKYITKEAVEKGEAQIALKGKVRKILIPKKLRKKLIRYVRKHEIEEGPIFRNEKGEAIHRSSVWQKMKRLARRAGVDERKVFPHNLRRLFARVFYRAGKDITKLADILGHTRIDTTRIYIQTTSREHERLLERLELVT